MRYFITKSEFESGILNKPNVKSHLEAIKNHVEVVYDYVKNYLDNERPISILDDQSEGVYCRVRVDSNIDRQGSSPIVTRKDDLVYTVITKITPTSESIFLTPAEKYSIPENIKKMFDEYNVPVAYDSKAISDLNYLIEI